MKLTKKMKILIVCVVFFVCASAVGMGFGFAAIPWQGTASSEYWGSTKTFDYGSETAAVYSIENAKHSDAVTGEKEFVILNLADIQLNSLEIEERIPTFKMLKKLIAQVDPDLITLTGDQVSGLYTRGALKEICDFLDGFDIPWAPVLGNHDGEGNITRLANADIFLEYKNVVFRKNATELGVGNYIIGIEAEGKPVHAVFMIDSHNKREYPDGKDYDYIWDAQISWYEWAIKGLQEKNANIKSSAFFHIALREYKDAWDLYQSGGAVGLGDRGENECPGKFNSGMFAKMKELGSTDLVVVGHDHKNNYVVEYQGITLAYGMKSGYGSYYDEDRVGGTKITVHKDGSHELEHIFMEKP